MGRPTQVFALLGAAWAGALLGGIAVLRFEASGRRPLSPLGPPGPASGRPDVVTLQAKVDALARRLTEAQSRVIALEGEQIKAAAATRPGGSAAPFSSAAEAGGPDLAALARIPPLPPNPSKAQATAYVRAVMSASARQTMYSSSDPQPAMLATVGHENLGVLLATTEGQDLYLLPAVGLLATDADKLAVIAALRSSHWLIKLVVDHGWEADAKGTLLSVLGRNPVYLPTEWINAVVRFRDPGSYPALRDYLANGLNPTLTLKAVADLPGIDLGEWVREGWRGRKPPSFGLHALLGNHDVLDFAPIAAAYGHADALASLFKALGDPAVQEWQRQEVRKHVEELTGQEGTDAELVDWHVKHRSALWWDAAGHRYRVLPTSGPTTTWVPNGPR